LSSFAIDPRGELSGHSKRVLRSPMGMLHLSIRRGFHQRFAGRLRLQTFEAAGGPSAQKKQFSFPASRRENR
jgi:hypothetical protein